MDGQVPKKYLIDSCRIISNFLENELLNNNAIYIKNFGTLFNYVFHGHSAKLPFSDEAKYVESFNSTKFIPDSEFSNLIREKKDFFKKK